MLRGFVGSDVPWDRHHGLERGYPNRVQVQSTWFPLIGRNPQTFVEIPEATEDDYQAVTQRIYRRTGQASHLTMNVLETPPRK